MAPLAVDPQALDDAGASIVSTGDGLGSVVSTLITALAGCGGMAGDDPAGAAFGRSYNSSASKLLEAMAVTRNGLCRLGDGVRMSAHNYSVAEAMSNVSGHGDPLPVPRSTGPLSAGASPSAVGSGTSAPAGWGWVAPFIGMIWPSGDSAKLRLAAAAWTSAGTNFELSEMRGAVGPIGSIAAQQIPESPAITAAFTEANRSTVAILQQCATIASQLNSYASKIDKVHAAILDLLSRICDPLTGLKEIWDILTHKDEDEIKKIANDIRTIVNNFTTEVDALRQQIAKTLHEATTIITTMGRYAAKEWDQFLHHTDVGRALNEVGQFGKGLGEEAGGLVKDSWTYGAIRPFVDPKGWYHDWSQMIDGMAPLVGLGGDQAPGVAQAWKDLGKNAVHWDEWKTNPAEASGKSTFDIASLFVPGGGEAAAAGKGARAAVDGAEAAAKAAPREAALPRALEGAPKPGAAAPAPHPQLPHEKPSLPHEEPAAPHEPAAGRPAPAPPPKDPSVPHDPTPHSPAEPTAPLGSPALAEEGPKPALAPADPGHGFPPPGGGSPPPPGQGPPPPPPSMTPHPSGDGIFTPPPAEPPPPPVSPPGENPLPAAELPQPAAATPAGEGPPPDLPHQPAAVSPASEGHLPPAEESHPAAAVPSAEGHTPADEVPQLVPAGAASSHLPLGGEPLPTAAVPAQAAVSAGAHSAELAPKAADAAQPRPAVAPGRPSHLPDAGQPHERPLTHNPGPHNGPPAEAPPQRPGFPAAETPYLPVDGRPHEPAPHDGAAAAGGRDSGGPAGQPSPHVGGPGDRPPEPLHDGSHRGPDDSQSADHHLDQNGGDALDNEFYPPGSLPSYHELQNLTKTDPDRAYYWSGRDASGAGVGPDGSGIAERMATEAGGTTLEMTLEKNGLHPLPRWNEQDPESVRFWEQASTAYAENAAGTVTAIIGSNVRPGNIWQSVEIPRLMENPNVAKIIQIDPDTGIPTVIFER